MDSDWTSPGVSPGLLHIKLLTLVLMLSFSLLCGFSPVCVLRRATRFSSDPGSRQRILSLASCLACGVFLASCLLELLPDFLNHTRDTFSRLHITLHYPLAEFVLAMGFLLVFVVEQMLLAFREQTCDVSLEKQALVDCEERSRRSVSRCAVDEGLRVFLLLFCVCVRAFLEGVSVGCQRQPLLETCVALMLYEALVAFSLAVHLTHHALRRTLVAGALLLFSVSCPAGIGAGLALDGLTVSPQVQLLRCAVEGLTAGIFINVCVLESVWQESCSPKHRIHKVAFLLTGFALVTAVLFSKV
ncbi:zinc transporter ZIP3 [Carassius carassius]|uniref:zinc transporter ZIP3 n=1 Tax=Carassius carassius TaxID=217509 RepID=UPI00286926F1|nr:zinc transporter ZIP3 [Carassius carassius]XP_059402953.1 zinc transporter ZIP3 [Carassius carassius]